MNFRSRLNTKLATALGLTAAIAITTGFQAAQAQNRGAQRQAIISNSLDEAGMDGEGQKQRDRRQGHRGPRFCADGGTGEHLEQMDAFLSAEVDLSTTQQDNWNTVLETFESLDVEAACAAEDREALREAGAQMREPLQAFRDSLSDEQKVEIRGFMEEQRDRHRAERNRSNDD